MATPVIVHASDGDNNTPIVNQADNKSLGITVLDDDLIEQDELIDIAIALELTGETGLQTYVEVTASDIQHTILNTETIDVTVSHVTDDISSCSGFSGESGCRAFKLTWDKSLQNVDAGIALKEHSNNKAVAEDVSNEDSELINPRDYFIKATSLGEEEYSNTDLIIPLENSIDVEGERSMIVEVHIYDDEFVEPVEKLLVDFAKPDNDAVIGNVGGSNSVEYDIPVDDKLTITIASDGADGLEPSYDVNGDLVNGKDDPFTYTTNLPVAPNVPKIDLTVYTILNGYRYCPGDSVCGTKNEDLKYEVTFNIHESDDATLAHTKSLGVKILPDNKVEPTESIYIMLDLKESSDYVDLDGVMDGQFLEDAIKYVKYDILNDDIAEITIEEITEGSNCENDSSGDIKSVKENDECVFEYKFSTDAEFSDDINISMKLSEGGANTVSLKNNASKDMSLRFGSGDDSGLVESGYSGETKSFNIVSNSDLSGNMLTLTVNNDSIVELDEILDLVVINEAGGEYIEFESYQIQKTIMNDDFIDLSLDFDNTCDSTSVSGVITELSCEEGTSIEFKIDEDYKTEGVGNINIELSVNSANSTVEEADYSLVNSISLPADFDSDSASPDADLHHILTLQDDKVIEVPEAIALTLIKPEFIRINRPSTIGIKNTDFFDVSLSVNEEPANMLLEGSGHTLDMKVCIPSELSLESDSELSVGIGVATNSDSESPVFKRATGSEGTVQGSVTIPVSSLGPDDCVTKPIYAVGDNDTVEQSTTLELTFTSNDMRCDGNCLGNQQVIIVNDDYTNMTDTGLVKCIKNGRNKRWGVDCNTEVEVTEGYDKQDAVETDYYAELTYIYINEDGLPTLAPEKDGDDVVSCFMDNTTGFVWSQSLKKDGFSSDYNVEFETVVVSPDCYDNELDDMYWQLPTIQELTTILNLNPDSLLRAFENNNLLGLKKINSKIYNAKSKYWTNDQCTVEQDNDGVWTLDLHTSIIECTKKTNKAHKMHLYK